MQSPKWRVIHYQPRVSFGWYFIFGNFTQKRGFRTESALHFFSGPIKTWAWPAWLKKDLSRGSSSSVASRTSNWGCMVLVDIGGGNRVFPWFFYSNITGFSWVPRWYTILPQVQPEGQSNSMVAGCGESQGSGRVSQLPDLEGGGTPKWMWDVFFRGIIEIIWTGWFGGCPSDAGGSIIIGVPKNMLV